MKEKEGELEGVVEFGVVDSNGYLMGEEVVRIGVEGVVVIELVLEVDGVVDVLEGFCLLV